MKVGLSLLCAIVAPLASLAGNLPFITIHPTNQVAAPGVNATLFVESTNATSYQWRFNGVDIPWGTNSLLVVMNAQSSNNGYYMAVAKNETGWTPSQMGFLSVVGSARGYVPFSNNGNANARADYHYGWCISGPITNGLAQLLAGPALDWMLPVGAIRQVYNGYYGGGGVLVPTVAPGQAVYYLVNITYTNDCYWNSNVHPSTTLKLVAGNSALNPGPSTESLRFPIYLEWPDPIWTSSPTNRSSAVGENVSFLVSYYTASTATLPVQWRKDGNDIPGATNSTHTGGPPYTRLTLTNVSVADVGVYDVRMPLSYGTPLSPKFTLSVQTTAGGGMLLSPRKVGSTFACDLQGIAGRNYSILWSTNLANWSQLTIVTNTTGSSTFSDVIGETRRYYRAMLLP